MLTRARRLGMTERNIKAYCFCSTVGNSIGGAHIVYTPLQLSLWLDLVSHAVPCASILDVCFDPF